MCNGFKDGVKMDRLQSFIEDELLEFASLSQDVTTSDLQGIATVKARQIIELVKGK